MSKKLKQKSIIPIKYFLTLPLIKADLRDEKGNEIKDILNIQEFRGEVVVMTKDAIYTTDDKVFKKVPLV